MFNMLLYNGVPVEDIIYTNCDDEKQGFQKWPLEKVEYMIIYGIFLSIAFLIKKIYIIFVTSENTKKSWGALTEVGAAWITQANHKVFNIADFRPEHPLDDESQWHISFRDSEEILQCHDCRAIYLLKKLK